jgi:hypothetical protein
MAQIEPIQIWKNGQVKVATIFDLKITIDDLSSSASFCYSLIEESTNVLISGNLEMSTDEYAEWDNSNEAAYLWAAEKLGLVIIR